MAMPASAFSGTAPAGAEDYINFDGASGGGCGLVKTPPTNPPGMGLLLFALFILPLSVWTRFRFRKQN